MVSNSQMAVNEAAWVSLDTLDKDEHVGVKGLCKRKLNMLGINKLNDSPIMTYPVCKTACT